MNISSDMRITVKSKSCFRWSHICFRYESATEGEGGEHDAAILEDIRINNNDKWISIIITE